MQTTCLFCMSTFNQCSALVNIWMLANEWMPSYLTELQMMMMSNTAKKKESRTPTMICSSRVSSLSTTERGGADRVMNNITKKTTTNKQRASVMSYFNIHLSLIPAVLTCSEYSESVYSPFIVVALNLNLVNVNMCPDSGILLLHTCIKKDLNCCVCEYVCCGLTRRQYWASEGRYRNDLWCSPPYSCRLLQSRIYLRTC